MRRIIGWSLVVALVATTIALVFTLRTLSAVKAERIQLIQWQAGILDQLGKAMRPTDITGGSARLAAADAPEALAEVIASRDGALKLLAMPKPYPLAVPLKRPDGSGRAASGEATAPDVIAQLQSRQSTGTAADDANAVEHDSEAPWKGWQ